MSLLLDTHVFLWWLRADIIDSNVATRISDPSEQVFISAASIWEAKIKQSLGKLKFEGSLIDAAQQTGFDLLSISPAHAECAGSLPGYHRDPFDRMLIAQSICDKLTIITHDFAFKPYDISVIFL